MNEKSRGMNYLGGENNCFCSLSIIRKVSDYKGNYMNKRLNETERE